MKTSQILHPFLIGTGSVLFALGGPLSPAQTPHLTRVLASVPNGNAAPFALQPADPAEAPQKETIVGPKVADSLFAGTEKFAKGASNVTEVNMGPQSLDLVEGADAKRARRTVLSEVRTYTYDKPGMYNPADLDEFRHRLETGDWQCSVHTRDMKSGTSTDICSRRRAPDMIEKAIITMEPKQLTFIHNIRRTDGDGSKLDDQGATILLPDLGDGVDMAFLSPELEANLLSAQAKAEGTAAAQAALSGVNQQELQGQMEALGERTRHLPLPSGPGPQELQELQRQMQNLPRMERQQDQQRKALQRQLEQLRRQQGE